VILKFSMSAIAAPMETNSEFAGSLKTEASRKNREEPVNYYYGPGITCVTPRSTVLAYLGGTAPRSCPAELLPRFFRLIIGWRSAPSSDESVATTCPRQEDNPRKSGSHQTRRWREMDSNPRSPAGKLRYETAS